MRFSLGRRDLLLNFGPNVRDAKDAFSEVFRGTVAFVVKPGPG